MVEKQGVGFEKLRKWKGLGRERLQPIDFEMLTNGAREQSILIAIRGKNHEVQIDFCRTAPFHRERKTERKSQPQA